MARQDVFNGWVELRDPDLVPEKLRRPLLEFAATGASFNTDEATPEAIKFFSEFNDLLAVAVIEAWSFGDVTLDGLLELPKRTYDEIRGLVAPLFTRLMPSFETDPDPKVITAS